MLVLCGPEVAKELEIAHDLKAINEYPNGMSEPSKTLPGFLDAVDRVAAKLTHTKRLRAADKLYAAAIRKIGVAYDEFTPYSWEKEKNWDRAEIFDQLLAERLPKYLNHLLATNADQLIELLKFGFLKSADIYCNSAIEKNAEWTFDDKTFQEIFHIGPSITVRQPNNIHYFPHVNSVLSRLITHKKATENRLPEAGMYEAISTCLKSQYTGIVESIIQLGMTAKGMQEIEIIELFKWMNTLQTDRRLINFIFEVAELPKPGVQDKSTSGLPWLTEALAAIENERLSSDISARMIEANSSSSAPRKARI